MPEEFASKMIAMVTRHKGEIERRVNGSMISMDTGNAFAYAIDKLQYRGKFFIDPGEDFK